MTTNEFKHKTLHELEKIVGFKIPRDAVMTVIAKSPEIDVLELDNLFSKRDSDYDNEKCTYKQGEITNVDISMNDYIKLKWGEEVLEKFKLFVPPHEDKSKTL